jgi:cytochrome c oxidase assembly protein subunit 15
MNSTPNIESGSRGLLIGLGFATTTMMWALGYLAFSQPGMILGELVFAAELLVLAIGGFFAGRLLGTISAGIWTGLISAAVNLLVVGSLFGRGEDGSILASGIAWVGGLFMVSALLGGIGATIGRLQFDSNRPHRIAPASFFSLVAAGTVFVLIVTGGLVTGMEAGLAVPDWPNSFGHNMLLYPLSEMKGGIFYEHAHRLYGMLVGVTAITLVVMVFRYDKRGWVRWVAGITFLMVCVQGLMGGLRVTGEFTTSQTEVDPSTTFAVAHGVFGQLTFAAFVTLATVSSGRWRDTASPAVRIPQEDGDRHWSSMLLAALLIQLFLGACYRHFATPALDGAPAPVPPGWAMYGHLTFSLVALVTALFAGLRAKARRADGVPMVPGLGRTVNLLVGIQFTLGVLAFLATVLRRTTEIPIWELIPTSAHQANGALLLGAAAALLVAIRRFEKPSESGDRVIQNAATAVG